MLTGTFIFLFILSFLINITLMIILRNQLRKVSIYEKTLKENYNFIDFIRNNIKQIYLKMRIIDNKELFFKDDDVGFVFTELLSLLKELNDRVE